MNNIFLNYEESFKTLNEKITNSIKNSKININEKIIKNMNLVLNEMENILNNMEIEVSLLSPEEIVNYDKSTKNHRNEYNKILNKFRNIEKDFYDDSNNKNINMSTDISEENINILKNNNLLFPSLSHIPMLNNYKNQRLIFIICITILLVVLYKIII